ncbi:MAG: STAS domain-containing protein [Salinisphaera sp.]|nr:STAS domain-containing protein [Salinisphaera sp.]
MKKRGGTTRVDRQADGVYLGGQLNAVTVPGLLPQIDDWLNAKAPMIDLAGIERSDSSGAALLLEVARRARAASAQVLFRNPPSQLRAIIAFCGLEQILAFA